jgi:CRP-like cAMP-binding protein
MIDTADPAGLEQDLRRRSVAPGDSIVAKPNEPPSSYLVESGVVAVSVALDRTPPTCVELLGAGALIGFPAEADTYASEFRAISSVSVLEIPSGVLQRAMQRQPSLQETHLRQLRERILQTELVAVCNAHHSLAGRCVHWLLRLHARLGPVLPVTHAFLATMLGVRRAGISITLEVLQRSGLVRQRRGSIEVLDSVALASYACPCPHGASNPANAISATLISGDDLDTERPRIWFEREIKVPAPTVVPGNERLARRETALRLCRNVVSRGLTALEG